MPFESPVEFNPEDFSLQNIRERYLDLQVVLDNGDVILHALLITLALALLAEVLGSVLGLFLALLKISRSKILSLPAQGYIDVFRGTPLLVQLIIIYYSTPLIGIRFESLFFAGLVTLALNSAAYVAEIFRAGIQSIHRGQMEAGRASGLSYVQTMRYIIVPQAFRRSIPPLTNEFLTLIKDTSIISVIGLEELLRAARVLQSATFSASPLVAAALIYATNFLERRLNRKTA